MLINEIINKGNEILQKSRQQYLEDSQPSMEQLDTIQTLDMLNGDESKNTRLENLVEKKKSYIKYIDLISNELNLIKDEVLMDKKQDFQYGCLYFGNGTLYYCDEFLKYSVQEQFEIVLNHICHYLGAFYIMNDEKSKSIRLSYIMASVKICYGEDVKLNQCRDIYKNYKNDFPHIIFDILPTYKKFILNNKGNFRFLKVRDSITQQMLLLHVQLNHRKIQLQCLRLNSNLSFCYIENISNKLLNDRMELPDIANIVLN